MRLIDADKLLERMKKGMESGSNLNGTFDLYIEHAPTVKPNGDLISRHDAFRTYQVKVCHDVACSECQTIDADGTCLIEAWLKDIPSADRPTGEWVDIDNYYRMATCSRCHKVTMFEKWGEYTRSYNYCPNCGARMYKGGEEE